MSFWNAFSFSLTMIYYIYSISLYRYIVNSHTWHEKTALLSGIFGLLDGSERDRDYPFTSTPNDRHVPSIIFMAPSMSLAFMSTIFRSAISRT